MSEIEVFSPYGNPREQARRGSARPMFSADDTPHGLTANQISDMERRMEDMLPVSVSKHGAVRDVLSDLLPEGASLAPGAGAGLRDAQRRHANLGSGNLGLQGNGTFQTNQRPYQPEFESPDRQQYPVHRILANRSWRLFYKMDPVIGIGIDMFGELPWGSVEFSGDGVDGEVKDRMEYSWEECEMRNILPSATREFFVVGEAAPHLFFDDKIGCWTYCALHNPDQLEVIDAPFVKMDPVVEFVPDQRLQMVLNSNHAMLRQVRESMPPELLARLMSRQNIPLSPVNFTFLPRKLHPYDTRGTSIISRMWRILMYEDCATFGTRIYTPEGCKNVEDVKVGDTVVAQDGSLQTVTASVIKDPQPVRRFTLRGKTVTTTPSHRWPVRRGDTKPVKMEAREIEVGDYFMVPRRFEEVDTYTPAMARLLGYYLAEGCITRLNHLTFTFHEDETQTWAADTQRLLSELDIESTLYPYNGRMAVCVRAHKLPPELLDLVEWLRAHGGQGSAEKSLSSEVMAWPVGHKFELLCGYLRGDGSVTSRRGAPTVSVGTVSEMLYEQLWVLFAHLGWPVGHTRVHEHNGKDGRQRLPLRTYTITGPTADLVTTEVFDRTVDRERGSRPQQVVLQDDDFMYYPIKSIEELPPEPVVGITVTGDHSYVANGFATYNSIYNASIATARRHAGPLKVAKLGNPQTGWIPGPEHERRLLELLANAELDPVAWLVYHHGINFELVGTTERVMSIDKHNETIERIKLIALGISKAFLHGEVTYASAESGLTVFLQRLKALRQYFESKWLRPKFFRQMAKINKWVRPSEAELSNRVRVRRSHREIVEDARYIVPELQWDRSLDSTVDSEMINAMDALSNLGVEFSKSTMFALAGKDFEEETKQRVRDWEFEKENIPPEMMAQATPEGGGLGGGGGGMMPGIPAGSFGDDLGGGGGEPALDLDPGGDGGGDAPPPPAGAGYHADDGDESGEGPDPFKDTDRVNVWSEREVTDLIEFLKGDEPQEEPWIDAFKSRAVRRSWDGGDGYPEEIWEAVEDWMADEQFPEDQVRVLVDILKKKRVLPRGTPTSAQRSAQLLDMIDGSDGGALVPGTERRPGRRQNRTMQAHGQGRISQDRRRRGRVSGRRSSSGR